MAFADLALAKRLERAEGHACWQYAQARCRVIPGCGSEWMECAGANVVFDGVESPITQTFALGILEELTTAALDTIERFFSDRGASTSHEICPLVGPSKIALLCDRGYRPIEVSSVLYRSVEPPAPLEDSGINVIVAGPKEAPIWADINARAWTHDHPELLPFMQDFGTMAAARDYGSCFLAEFEGQPAAAGSLSIHDGVAVFAGAATLAEFRCRGLQGALLQARLQYAFEQGCNLAMMVAEAGSNSQRNAERKGFRIAYTRTKWQLPAPTAGLPATSPAKAEH
jgi:GNAT superfamily N-acetyltransferase